MLMRQMRFEELPMNTHYGTAPSRNLARSQWRRRRSMSTKRLAVLATLSPEHLGGLWLG